MSAMGDKKLDDRDKKRQFRGQANTTADWAGVDATTVLRAIASVARTGGALRFGYSRDGGVYAVGVLGDGEPYTLWERDAAQLDITLRELAEYFDDMEVSTAPSSSPKKRPK